MSKLMFRHGLTFLRSKIPALKNYLTPENIRIDVESDELEYLLSSSSTYKPSIIFIVSKNILLGAVGGSIEMLKNEFLRNNDDNSSSSSSPTPHKVNANGVEPIKLAETTPERMVINDLPVEFTDKFGTPRNNSSLSNDTHHQKSLKRLRRSNLPQSRSRTKSSLSSSSSTFSKNNTNNSTSNVHRFQQTNSHNSGNASSSDESLRSLNSIRGHYSHNFNVNDTTTVNASEISQNSIQNNDVKQLHKNDVKISSSTHSPTVIDNVPVKQLHNNDVKILSMTKLPTVVDNVPVKQVKSLAIDEVAPITPEQQFVTNFQLLNPNYDNRIHNNADDYELNEIYKSVLEQSTEQNNVSLIANSTNSSRTNSVYSEEYDGTDDQVVPELTRLSELNTLQPSNLKKTLIDFNQLLSASEIENPPVSRSPSVTSNSSNGADKHKSDNTIAAIDNFSLDDDDDI